MFATCDRGMALGFLRKLYPSRDVADTPEDAGPLLDIVEADIVRVQDPDYHRPCQIMPSKNWDASRHDEFVAICQKFHDGTTTPESN